MMLWPWRRSEPRRPVDPKPAAEAAKALADAHARWEPIRRTLSGHRRLQVENHLGARVADSFRDAR